MLTFTRRIRPAVQRETALADAALRRGDATASFHHLERAHVLGQASTVHHVRVHALMLLWALRHRDLRETIGQVTRIVGAATKTVFGWVPTGNTGGSNVSPFKPLPIEPGLAREIRAARETPTR